MNQNVSNYTPLENQRRIKLAMEALSAEREICFVETPSDINVSFKRPFDSFRGGKILLFQQFVFAKLGTRPEVIKQSPHDEQNPDDIQFSFSLRTTEAWNIFSLIGTAGPDLDKSKEAFRSLGISQLRTKWKEILDL
jgi:hypothetical protein